MNHKPDLLAIHFAGARLNPQPSAACPQAYYGDPARHVKFEREGKCETKGETKCSTCLYSRAGRAGSFCGKHQPYGKRCGFFKIVKKSIVKK